MSVFPKDQRWARVAFALAAVTVPAGLVAACSTDAEVQAILDRIDAAIGDLDANVPSGPDGAGCFCAISSGGAVACGETSCVPVDGELTGVSCSPEAVLAIDPGACPVTTLPTGDAAAVIDAGPPPVATVPDAGPLPTMACAYDGGACTASGCSCGQTSSCDLACSGTVPSAMIDCTQSASCRAACGDSCTVGCTQATYCEGAVGDAGTVTCGQAQQCGASLGANGNLGCGQVTNCVADVGAGSTVDCSQTGSCDLTVGDGGTVDCTESSSCKITCTGACLVDCTAGNCQITCPNGQQPLSCQSSGKMYCGTNGC